MTMKRLVICCDGTWNDEDSGGGFTNVVRIARATKPIDERTDTRQIVYYHSGVGSGGDLFSHYFDGGTGLGLSRNIRDAYGFIAHNFCEGDELFFFGFSRGAYTARSLAGLIGWAGILHKGDMDDFAFLWEGFKRRKDPGVQDARGCFPGRHENVPVKCIGVWDTVGSLGIPGHLSPLFQHLYQFQDTTLGKAVENAFHALALDEHRGEFVPTLWQRNPASSATQRLEQVWFAGAHANVGGGYEEHGASDVALAWMADRVDAMLGLDYAYLASRRDQRQRWCHGSIVDSRTGIFRLFGSTNRNIRGDGSDGEGIHASVVTRWVETRESQQPEYKPPALPDGVTAAMRVAALGEAERTLSWGDANPKKNGTTGRPLPQVSDPLMKRLNI